MIDLLDLVDMVEDIKQKISDKEYKDIMDKLMEKNKDNTKSLYRVTYFKVNIKEKLGDDYHDDYRLSVNFDSKAKTILCESLNPNIHKHLEGGKCFHNYKIIPNEFGYPKLKYTGLAHIDYHKYIECDHDITTSGDTLGASSARGDTPEIRLSQDKQKIYTSFKEATDVLVECPEMIITHIEKVE